MEKRSMPAMENPRLPHVPDHSLQGDDPAADTQQSNSKNRPSKATTHQGADLPFGSGLKRPLELDDQGRPIIKRRKVVEVVTKTSQSSSSLEIHAEGDESDWSGLSSRSEDDDDFVDRDEETEDQSDESNHESDDSTSDTSLDEAAADGVADDEEAVGKMERLSAFKSWATQQRNEALGFTAANNLDSIPTSHDQSPRPGPIVHPSSKHSPESRASASLLPKVPPMDFSATRVFNVRVHRAPEVEEARLALPVVAEEQKIMEAIRNNDIVVICGETGSGKTTQVPQFLFEAGYGNPAGPSPGMIGVTQPRRVAAVSMSKRVAAELGDSQAKVAHQIRFDSTVSAATAVKFMTDGVLLREVGEDFTLSKYSAIIIDEAHERSVNTDMLIGMLSRIVETRAGLAKKSEKYTTLKLVIMSATLRTSELVENKTLFRHITPPIIQAEGRQHFVTIHFAKRTERDYLEQVFSKITRGHRKLPQGAMLVFLTGQNEIQHLSKRLRQTFASTDGSAKDLVQVRVSAADVSIEDEDLELGKQGSESHDENTDSESDVEIKGADNDDQEFDIGEDPEELLKVHILPLYSQLPTEQQMRVFQPPPPGSRLIVLATNVAETSLTIPGVRYVFDCGRAKQKQYDRATGVQNFGISWISKASASQRAGRAGRTGPGHCYRLYSSAVYERDFEEFSVPEILRAPIEGVVLQLKSMGIPKITNFPFPTPPDRDSLLKSERLLEYLGALANGKITAMGKRLALYPLSPRLARMLCTAQDVGTMELGISLVAILGVGDVFIPEAQLDLNVPKPGVEDEWTERNNVEEAEREQRRKEYNSFHGSLSRLGRLTDALKLLIAIHEFASPESRIELFRRYTRIKALSEAIQLRQQLTTIISTYNPSVKVSLKTMSSEPSKAQIRQLSRVIASGYIDQIAQRADLSPTPPTGADGRSNKPKRATDVPYLTLLPSHENDSKAMSGVDEDPENIARRKFVYIHPSSVLAHQSPAKLPQYIVYSHLSQSAATTIDSARLPRTRMHPLTPITVPEIIATAQGTPLLEEGKPIGRIESLERDDEGRERRSVWTIPFLVSGHGSGDVGWPLPPARKAIQRREGPKGWVLERSVDGGQV